MGHSWESCCLLEKYQQQQRFEQKASFLRAGTLLLAAEQGRQGDIGNLHNLEPEKKARIITLVKLLKIKRLGLKTKRKRQWHALVRSRSFFTSSSSNKKIPTGFFFQLF